jgi:hypothetical protein
MTTPRFILPRVGKAGGQLYALQAVPSLLTMFSASCLGVLQIEQPYFAQRRLGLSELIQQQLGLSSKRVRSVCIPALQFLLGLLEEGSNLCGRNLLFA